jgi:Gpi18-like mannosyltransferase
MVLLFFPTSFFFGSYYTESIFLLFSVLVFYLARRGNFFLAGIFAMIASATRITGVFLWPALVIEFVLFYGKDIKKLLNANAVWLLLPPLGLLSYIKYQYLKTGNGLYFISSQPAFGASRTVDKIILIHQVLFRYTKMLIFVDHTSPLFFAVLLEFLTGIGFLGLIIYGLNKLRSSYLVYVALSFFLPTFTGTFSSMPRYVLVLFPLFALIAVVMEKLPPRFTKVYFTISAILAIITIALFTRGYFIG